MADLKIKTGLPSEEANKSDRKMFHCSHCDYDTDLEDDLHKHEHVCHSEEDESPASTSLLDNRVKYSDGNDISNGTSEENIGGFPVFRCDQCEYETFSFATLSSHQKTHLIKKLYQCDVCHMKFSQAANMRRHKMRHTGIKPFECRICMKRFFRKDHLMEHMVTHSKHLPFQCPMCEKSFHRQVHLKAHLSSEHSGAPCDRVCNICGYRAATVKGAKLHYTTRHARHLNSVVNSCKVEETSPPTSSPSDLHMYAPNDVGGLPRPLQFVTPLSSVHRLLPAHTSYPTRVPSPSSKPFSGVYTLAHSNLETMKVGSAIPTSTSNDGHAGTIPIIFDAINALPNSGLVSPKRTPQLSPVYNSQHPYRSNESEPSASVPSSSSEQPTGGTVVVKQESPDQVCIDEDEDERSSSVSVETSHDSDWHHISDRNSAPDSSRHQQPANSSILLPKNTLTPCQPELEVALGIPTPKCLKCTHCGIIFPDQTLYFLHKGVHSENIPWKCNICGEMCHNKYDFNAHILSKAHQ